MLHLILACEDDQAAVVPDGLGVPLGRAL